MKLSGMLKIIAVSLIWIVFTILAAGQDGTVSYVVKNVSVIDLENNATLEYYDVIIEENRISGISPSNKSEHPKAAIIIDGTGKF